MIAELSNGSDQKVRLEALKEEVSASRLNLWSTCRLKFSFRYVQQVVKPPTPALHLGKSIHAALQAWNMARWRGEEFTPPTAIKFLEERWKEQEPGIDWDHEEAGQREKAVRMLEAYFRSSTIPPDEKPHAVEVRLEADLANHGLPTLIGILDLVRPPGIIVDFKTSAQTPEVTRLIHQTELQLTCYAILYREATSKQEIGFELHHLVKQKVPKAVITPLSKANDRQVSRLFRTIESYVQGVDRQDFVPSPGLHCTSCEYFRECRRWS